MPAHQTFLSRDRGDGLHRYGYTGGDPIGRIDPSGRRFTAAELGRAADRMVDRLTPGIGAYLEPIVPVWGQVLGGVQLAALLPAFWHHPTTQGDITFGFLAASIASEALSAPRGFDARFASPMSAFRWRLLTDVTLGATQTAAQSYRHGHVDVPALVQGIDTTTYGIVWARLTAGIGYRPFNLSARDLDAGVAQFYADHAGSTDVLVFRVRENLSHLNSTVGGAGRALSRLFDGPLCDQASVGMYHEAVVAVGPDEVVRSELRGDWTVRDNERRQYPYHGFVAGTARYGDGHAAAAVSSRGNAAFIYVGRFTGAKGLQLLDLNPYRFPTPENIDQQLTPPNHDDPTSYNWRTRNAHYHVAAVLRQLRR